MMGVLADIRYGFIDRSLEFSDCITENPDASLDELLVAVLRRLTGRNREILGSVLRYFYVEEICNALCFEHFGIEIGHVCLLK